MVEEYGLVLTYLPPSPPGEAKLLQSQDFTFSHTQKPGNGLVRENLLLKFVDDPNAYVSHSQ